MSLQLSTEKGVVKSRPSTDESDSLVEFLKKSGPFGSLKPERLLLLAKKIVPLSLKGGGYIIREGEAGGSCFVIRSGQVEVLQTENNRQKQVAILGPGSLFGEAALLTDSPRNASVRTIESTELIEIRREDFLKAIDENRQFGRQLFELLNLRDRPIRKPDITEQTVASEDGSEITILTDSTRGTYFRLSAAGRLIWQNLDGHHNLKDLTLLYLEKLQIFSPHTIAETIAALVSAGFAESRTTQARFLMLPPWGQRAFSHVRHLLEWRLVIKNVDEPLTHFYQVVAPFLFSRIGQTALALFSVTGLILFLQNLHLLVPLIRTWSHPHTIAFLFLLSSGIFHEAGHALTTKAFKRKVLGMGLGWNWISPILFVDTSDMWLSPRWQRILVSLAGPYTHLMIGGVATILSIFTSGTPNEVLNLFATGSYLLCLLNLLPILNFDGHYVWQELRERRGK